MRTIISSAMSILFSVIAFSQNDSIFYFDKHWQIADKSTAVYYKIVENCKLRQKLCKISGYCITGEKQRGIQTSQQFVIPITFKVEEQKVNNHNE